MGIDARDRRNPHIVLKPAEVTPMTAMYLGRLILEAGIPKGVVNIVPGYGAAAGKALVEHPDVHLVSFTGSTAVGREIGASASRNLKHVSLELGGKSPIVLFDDCDLEPAIDAALSGIFLNTGQVCSAASRLLVQDGIYDKVVAGLSERARKMKVGRAFEAGTEMGPVVSRKQYDTVSSFLELGRKDGEITAGGVAHDPSGGYLIEPTIVAGLNGDSRLVQEEIFGPVLAVERFSDFEDGLRKANAGRYGLAASVWTNNGSTAQRFVHGIASGTVWVNCYHMYDIAVPWGGVKDSGIGRERSFDGIANLLSKKTVWSAIR
ncbi:aldehyde dehydrogenase family protein [Sphingobium olei]|uniref:Aldehyde dehydrogenase family protein n=1 Tax=Sphingobium olei TaxID=420955 RepID=A0ABW3P9V0_9SPHN